MRGGPERFLAFSLETRLLTEQREVMRVSCAHLTENEYTAPSQAGAYTVWAVLRDNRGGVTWNSIRVNVK